MSEANSEVNTGRVLAGYLKLREKKAELKKVYDAQTAELDAQMEKIEAWLLSNMQASGSDQLKVRGVATAFTQTKIKASAADWNLVWQFMKDHERWDVLEKRLSSTFVKEYIAENDVPPPGVNVFQELVVVVRKD